MDVNEELKFFVKIKKKKKIGGVEGAGSGWGGGQGGFKIKNLGGGQLGGSGSGWGIRVDVNEELKFFVKIQKKKNWGGGGGLRLGGGSGWM